FARAGARQADGANVAGLVALDRRRRQPFGEADALLQRLLDLFVVQRVARRIDQPAAIGDGHPAPGIEQLADARRAVLLGGGPALRADGAGVAEELVGDGRFVRRPGRTHCALAALGGELLVAAQELLHL